LPKSYFDLAAYKAALEKAQTPATPAVTVFIALQESLRLMAEEGLEAIIRRHQNLARATRRGLQAVNLQLFADERHASPAVTAFRRARCEGRQTTGLKEPELASRVADVDALIVRSETKVTAAILGAAKRLQVVGRAGVGVDNIDVPAATARGVYVVNAPLGNIA